MMSRIAMIYQHRISPCIIILYQCICVAKRLQAPRPKQLQAPRLALTRIRTVGLFAMRRATPTPGANLPPESSECASEGTMGGCKLPHTATRCKAQGAERTHSSHVRSSKLSTSEFEFNHSESAAGRPASSHALVQTMRGTKYRNLQMADCWQRLSWRLTPSALH